ncbi:MAG: hypothetical protein ACHQIG_12690 [Acidimicrobiia bacterium]
MDLSKLSTGDKVIGVSGILLLIFSFFPWLGFSVGSFSASKSAWSFTLLWFAVIIGVALVVLVVLKATGTELPKVGNITWNQIMSVAAIVVFGFILIKLIAGPGTGGVSLAGTGVSKDRKIGVFLGLAASIGLVVGSVMNLREAGEMPGKLGGAKGGDTPPAP